MEASLSFVAGLLVCNLARDIATPGAVQGWLRYNILLRVMAQMLVIVGIAGVGLAMKVLA